jgi:hypothetical protein
VKRFPIKCPVCGEAVYVAVMRPSYRFFAVYCTDEECIETREDLAAKEAKRQAEGEKRFRGKDGELWKEILK